MPIWLGLRYPKLSAYVYVVRGCQGQLVCMMAYGIDKAQEHTAGKNENADSSDRIRQREAGPRAFHHSYDSSGTIRSKVA